MIWSHNLDSDIHETHVNKMSLHEYAGFIAENRINGMSCGDITAALCTQFGTTQVFSERNVRRWCAEQVPCQGLLCWEAMSLSIE